MQRAMIVEHDEPCDPMNYLFWGLLLGPVPMFTAWILQAWLAGNLKISIPEGVRPAAELAVHIVTGSVLFALVFSAAACINLLIDFFVQRSLTPSWIVEPTHILEAIVWGGDVLAFLLFTAVQLLIFCKKITIANAEFTFNGDFLFPRKLPMAGSEGPLSVDDSRVGQEF
jgi:hypothetical protein